MLYLSIFIPVKGKVVSLNGKCCSRIVREEQGQERAILEQLKGKVKLSFTPDAVAVC